MIIINPEMLSALIQLIRGHFSPKAKTFLLGMASLYYIMWEFQASKPDRRKYDVLKNKLRVIDPTIPDDIDGFVYFNVTNHPYPKHLKSGIEAACVYWRVEFCRWTNFDSEFVSFLNGPVLPKKVWTTDRYVPVADWGLFSVTDIQHNPDIPSNIKSSMECKDVKVGNYEIKSSIFQSAKGFTPYRGESVPRDARFQWLGNGWFYRPNRENKVISEEVEGKRIDSFMRSCESGDVRARYEIYAPDKFSVVGWKEKGQIGKRTYRGVQFGEIRRGLVAPESIFTRERKMISLWIPSILLFLLWSVFETRSERLCVLLVFGAANLVFRSFMRQTALLNVNVWGIFFVFSLIIAAICLKNERVTVWLNG